MFRLSSKSVGSVAGQLAGKAMGVVDSFSLKNAFTSGITAGLTAGVGSYLKGFEWAQAAGNASKFGTMGKMAMAAAGTGTNWAANKLAGNNNVSFSWRNVVTSAVGAGAGSLLGISDQSSLFSSLDEGAGLFSGTLDGIAGAALNYGVGKGLYNQGGWNFRNVATDAFGNALGQTLVSKISEWSNNSARDKAQQAKNNQILDDIGRKVSDKLDASQNETLATQQEQITETSSKEVDKKLATGAAALDARNDADLARYQAARISLADIANARSAEFAADAAALSARHNSQLANLRANSAAALADGMARGEAMHAAGLRNRAPVGVDLLVSMRTAKSF